MVSGHSLARCRHPGGGSGHSVALGLAPFGWLLPHGGRCMVRRAGPSPLGCLPLSLFVARGGLHGL
eukprot:12703765-Alexandrium_andersonii.AAC.1